MNFSRIATVAATVFFCSMRPASAQPAPPAEAEQLYLVGQAEYDKQHFDAALIAWERSYELSQEPALLFNIAQAYRLRGAKNDCATASTTYKNFVELDPTSPQRAAADGFIVETQKCMDASVAKPVIAKPTGPLTTTPPKDPGQPDVGNTDPGHTKRIVGIATVGTGVALIATGLYFGHRAKSIGDEVTRACATGCDWGAYGPKDADGHGALTKQYVFDGLGVAAIVGGGVLYWLGSREQVASPLVVTSLRDGAAITWSGSW